MLAFYMKSYLKFTLVAIPEGTGLSRILFTLRKKKGDNQINVEWYEYVEAILFLWVWLWLCFF